MMNPNWESYRLADNSIDLVSVFLSEADQTMMKAQGEALGFLQHIMSIQPIRSRQAAAVALAFAYSIGMR